MEVAGFGGRPTSPPAARWQTPLFAAMVFHAAVIICVSKAPIGDASPVPIRASVIITRMIITAKSERVTVDEARTYMPGIIAAVILVWIIIIEIARAYRAHNPRTLAATLDLDHIIPSAFGRTEKGLPGRCGIGDWCDARYADRKQASQQNRCKQTLITHEIVPTM